jgi:DHA3 family macrolide efflux protein-like MFS transporter
MEYILQSGYKRQYCSPPFTIRSLKNNDSGQGELMAANRNFILIIISETFSNLGLWLGLLANLQFLRLTVESDFIKSIILASGIIISILLSPKIGVMIDKYSKKKMMLWSSLVQISSACLMAIAMSNSSLPTMIIGLIIANIGNSIFIPTLQSVIPMVVEKDKLVNANAIYSNVVTFTRIVGTAIAGLLITLLSLSEIYLITLLIYLLMTATRSFFKFKEIELNINKSKDKRMSFYEVIPIMRSTPALIILIISGSFIFIFLGSFNLLTLKFSDYVNDPSINGWIYTIEGSFFILGGFVTRYFLKNGDLLKRNVCLLIGIATSFFIMHFANHLGILLGFSLFGFIAGCWLPTYSTIPQLIVPSSIRGRFFAFQQMWNKTITQAALLITGAMLDTVGVTKYILILSITVFAGFLLMYPFIIKLKIQVQAEIKEVV